MPNIEYLFQAVRRARFNRAANGKPFGFQEEQLSLAERNGCANPIAVEDLNEVVAMFDCGDDWQARSQIIDGLGRDAEAGHTWHGRDHPDVTCAEQLEEGVAGKGRPIQHVRLARRPLADRRRVPSVANKQKAKIGTCRQCCVGRCEHLLETAAFDQLTSEDCDRRLSRQSIKSPNRCSVDRRHWRWVTPNRSDKHPLIRANAKSPPQIVDISGQCADDGGETAEQTLLPGARDPQRQTARYPADFVMMVGEKVPDEQ
jgi:hypothetical protein